MSKRPGPFIIESLENRVISGSKQPIRFDIMAGLFLSKTKVKKIKSGRKNKKSRN